MGCSDCFVYASIKSAQDCTRRMAIADFSTEKEKDLSVKIGDVRAVRIKHAFRIRFFGHFVCVSVVISTSLGVGMTVSLFLLSHARFPRQLLDTRPLHGHIEWLEARKVVSTHALVVLRESFLGIRKRTLVTADKRLCVCPCVCENEYLMIS